VRLTEVIHLKSEVKQRKPATFERSAELQKTAHALIPGGAHTYAKGDDQYPVLAPGYIVRGEGCHVWDADGNEFIEYGMGLRAVTLGHAYRSVVEAAYQQMLLGSNFTRPATIEVECAQELLALIDGAEMVKFAKDGSDTTTGAIRLARAFTGRDMVARCADHPFFSVDDWFIGNTPMSAGIPQAIRDLTVKFRYNDIQSLQDLFDEHPGKIACVIMEAETIVAPLTDFLHQVQRLCRKEGAVFILDEMITGFRWHLGGAQKYYDVVPDLSTFGKAMSNGFSLSALVGRKEIMELGGLHHDKERVFLLSTTHGAENHSLAAAIETMRIYRREAVVEFLYSQGERLRSGINHEIQANDLGGFFEVLGKAPNLIYVTRDQEKKPSQEFRALFLQETIQRGLLMPSLVVSFSHTDAEVDRTIEVVGETLRVYRKALEDGVGKYLVGRPVKPVFRKFN
jgi:glutamate-1-semialdehyde 2,1-aminomutase